MRFIRPSFNDSHTLYEWRNDSATRKMMFNENPISWDEHQHWFETTLWGGVYIYMVLGEDDIPIGVIRFTQTDDPRTAEMHITIAPQMRGMGYGTRAIAEGVKWFLSNEGKRYSKVIARVKLENKASQRAFRAAGFKYFGCVVGSLVLEYDTRAHLARRTE